MAPPISEAAAVHAAEVLDAQALAVRAGRRAWSHVDPRFISESWGEGLRTLTPTVTAAQARVAAAGAEYGATALAEQGVYSAPAAFVRPAGLAGVAPDGRALQGLLYSPATTSKALIGAGVAPSDALASARGSLDRILQTLVADTSRQASSVDIAARPRIGYVRMLVGDSCPDCVILAGRFYRWNAGFMRHPGDDCVHVPTAQAASAGLVTDPYQHFWSMTREQQDAFWGPGDAQAIRDGADIYRVGNARRGARGMTTLEGTGRANRGGGRVGQLSGMGTSAGRGFASGIPGGRLTPDGIYATATSREQALTLLERHGYVLPGGQVPGGSILGSAHEGFGQMGRGGTRVGASASVRQAQATGVQSFETLTAAQRRVYDATVRWEQVAAGRNPYTGDGSGLTPDIAAKVETSYRRQVIRGGEVFTR